MPSSIKLELLINGTVVDLINVQVPGEHVKALTCAAGLVQQLKFSERDYKQRLAGRKSAPLHDENEMTDADKERLPPKEKEELEKKKAKEQEDIKGELYVKVEWKGYGPKMPPVKSENLFKKPKVHKNRNTYTPQQEQDILLKQLYIDVNDPRNQRIIKLLRETRNEFLKKLLADDAKNLLSAQ